MVKGTIRDVQKFISEIEQKVKSNKRFQIKLKQERKFDKNNTACIVIQYFFIPQSVVNIPATISLLIPIIHLDSSRSIITHTRHQIIIRYPKKKKPYKACGHKRPIQWHRFSGWRARAKLNDVL